MYSSLVTSDPFCNIIPNASLLIRINFPISSFHYSPQILFFLPSHLILHTSLARSVTVSLKFLHPLSPFNLAAYLNAFSYYNLLLNILPNNTYSMSGLSSVMSLTQEHLFYIIFSCKRCFQLEPLFPHSSTSFPPLSFTPG